LSNDHAADARAEWHDVLLRLADWPADEDLAQARELLAENRLDGVAQVIAETINTGLVIPLPACRLPAGSTSLKTQWMPTAEAAGRLQEGLVRAGEAAPQVEAYTAGTKLPEYHRSALSEAGELSTGSRQ
jgi:hypothetical protein